MVDLKTTLQNLILLNEEISEIIGYNSLLDCKITPLLNTRWCLSEDNMYVNFDRHIIGDMEDYGEFNVSSLGCLQEEFYVGQKDGLHFIMSYDEDYGWDSAEVYVFDDANRVEHDYE